jgi:hypothetical protein
MWEKDPCPSCDRIYGTHTEQLTFRPKFEMGSSWMRVAGALTTRLRCRVRKKDQAVVPRRAYSKYCCMYGHGYIGSLIEQLLSAYGWRHALAVRYCWVFALFLAYFPSLKKWNWAYMISMVSVNAPCSLLNAWTSFYAAWYVYYATWAHLSGVLHKSLPSVYVSVCLYVSSSYRCYAKAR